MAQLFTRQGEVIDVVLLLLLLTALTRFIIPFNFMVHRRNNGMRYGSRTEIITQIVEIVDEGGYDDDDADDRSV